MHIITASDKENNNNALNKIIKSGITFGSALAMVISYAACLCMMGNLSLAVELGVYLVYFVIK